jgi:Tol biopolymer transport system component
MPNGLLWVDRAGVINPLAASAKPYDNPRLSPDGKRIAVVVREDENHDIWLYDTDRGVLSKVTFGPGENETPAWAPTGQSLLFSANRSGASRLLLTNADGEATFG